VPKSLSNIPNPWRIFREDMAKVMEKESRVVLPKWWMRVCRFILLAYRKFDEERCFMRAAALSFNSLLAMIPVLALATVLTAWIVKDKESQSVQKFVSQIIVSVLPAEHENPLANAKIESIRDDLKNNITGFSNNLAGQVKFNKTGVLSALVFVYLGLLVVMQLEDTFNDLWSVRRSRAWYSQLLKFSPGLVLGPGCIILAFALTNGVHFEAISEHLENLTADAGGMGLAVNTLVPLLFAMAGLTFLYKLIPNTRVPWSAALWGGLVAGTLWQLNHAASAWYVSRVVVEKGWYVKAYGDSLGLLPVFMLAVYFTWLILLYGALVAARVQYHSTPLNETIEDKDAEPEKPEDTE
jgi:membrane protein